MSSCRNTDTAVWMSHIWKNIGSSSLWLFFFFSKSVQSRGRRETRMSVMREETEFEEEMLQDLKSGCWGNQGRLKSKFTVKVETPLIRVNEWKIEGLQKEQCVVNWLKIDTKAWQFALFEVKKQTQIVSWVEYFVTSLDFSICTVGFYKWRWDLVQFLLLKNFFKKKSLDNVCCCVHLDFHRTELLGLGFRKLLFNTWMLM